MKKSVLVLIIIGVAAISSAATVGVMKLIENLGRGGPIIILSDKRCVECDPAKLETALKRTFPEAKFTVLDYNDKKGKRLFKTEKLEMLPAVLIPKAMETQPEFEKIKRFTKIGEKYLSLRTGGKFDPEAEICDNKIDDNGNNLIDCKDPACKSDWKCMEKREKPDVDVFVMSHCPYGTQIEKGLLPVWDLIGNKINLNIRFCDYAMHGKKEIDEQLNQYCIQKAGKKKYRKYLECFLKEGKGDKCLKEAGVNKSKLAACTTKSDKEFNITKDFKDKKTWKGRFPSFNVDASLTKKYSVRGSPTLIINDVKAEAGRSPKSILDAVCTAFKTRPKECDNKLDSTNPSPGFGLKKNKGKGKGNCES